MKKSILVVFISIMILVLMSACYVPITFHMDRGSGNVITETRKVSSFSRVVLSGIGELIIKPGETESLTVEAEDNIVKKVITEVNGDTLTISYENPFNIMPTKPIIFYLTMKQINGIEISGAGDVKAENIHTDNLDIQLSGTGNFDISGKATEQHVAISGAGNYQAKDLETQQTSVTISGAGSATVWVDDSLDVTVSGAGSLDYYGNPSKVGKHISGAGSVTPHGEH